MTGSIYAPDYLRNQTDKQLHLIADTMETNLNTMSNLRIENADLQKQVDELKAKNYRIRCEEQSYINKIEEYKFNENQLHHRFREMKQQIADYEKALEKIVGTSDYNIRDEWYKFIADEVLMKHRGKNGM